MNIEQLTAKVNQLTIKINQLTTKRTKIEARLRKAVELGKRWEFEYLVYASIKLEVRIQKLELNWLVMDVDLATKEMEAAIAERADKKEQDAKSAKTAKKRTAKVVKEETEEENLPEGQTLTEKQMQAIESAIFHYLETKSKDWWDENTRGITNRNYIEALIEAFPKIANPKKTTKKSKTNDLVISGKQVQALEYAICTYLWAKKRGWGNGNGYMDDITEYFYEQITTRTSDLLMETEISLHREFMARLGIKFRPSLQSVK